MRIRHCIGTGAILWSPLLCQTSSNEIRNPEALGHSTVSFRFERQLSILVRLYRTDQHGSHEGSSADVYSVGLDCEVYFGEGDTLRIFGSFLGAQEPMAVILMGILYFVAC